MKCHFFIYLGEVITITEATLLEGEYNEACCKGSNGKQHSISEQSK